MLRELFAEVHALKGSVGVCRGRVELELRFVLLPEVLAVAVRKIKKQLKVYPKVPSFKEWSKPADKDDNE